MTSDGPAVKTTDDVFKGRKVALVAVPGAFTPTCDRNHLPGYVKHEAELKGRGPRCDRRHLDQRRLSS